jgi:hypothetical protein
VRWGRRLPPATPQARATLTCVDAEFPQHPHDRRRRRVLSGMRIHPRTSTRAVRLRSAEAPGQSPGDVHGTCLILRPGGVSRRGCLRILSSRADTRRTGSLRPRARCAARFGRTVAREVPG